MDAWKQERYAELNKALELIQRRAGKVVQAADTLRARDQGQQQQQQRQQASNLANELARLQDMNDRLFDFRDRLYFYSNLGYVESLNEWQYEIRKICVRAQQFEDPPSTSRRRHHHHHHHHNHHHHHHHRIHRHNSSDGIHTNERHPSHKSLTRSK